MKRVTTSLEADGRASVVVEELDPSVPQALTEYRPGETPAWLALMDPAAAHTAIEPPEGVMRWFYAPIPPEGDTEAAPVAGMEGDGFHETRTVDFNVVLSGELTLIVAGQEILLQAGDLVLQQGPRHRWRNVGATTATMLSLSHRPG